MVMNSGSQELSQFDSDPECASQSEVARSSLIQKYGKVLLVVAALVLVAFAAGRATGTPHWTAAPDEAVKLQVAGPVANFGAQLSAYSAGKPWPTICSVIYSLPPGDLGTHPAGIMGLLKAYDDLDNTQEQEVNRMIMTSMSAAGQTCAGVNSGTMCGSRRRRL